MDLRVAQRRAGLGGEQLEALVCAAGGGAVAGPGDGEEDELVVDHRYRQREQRRGSELAIRRVADVGARRARRPRSHWSRAAPATASRGSPGRHDTVGVGSAYGPGPEERRRVAGQFHQLEHVRARRSPSRRPSSGPRRGSRRRRTGSCATRRAPRHAATPSAARLARGRAGARRSRRRDGSARIADRQRDEEHDGEPLGDRRRGEARRTRQFDAPVSACEHEPARDRARRPGSGSHLRSRGARASAQSAESALDALALREATSSTTSVSARSWRTSSRTRSRSSWRSATYATMLTDQNDGDEEHGLEVGERARRPEARQRRGRRRAGGRARTRLPPRPGSRSRKDPRERAASCPLSVRPGRPVWRSRPSPSVSAAKGNSLKGIPENSRRLPGPAILRKILRQGFAAGSRPRARKSRRITASSRRAAA